MAGPVEGDYRVIGVLAKVLLGKAGDVGHVLVAAEAVGADHDPAERPSPVLDQKPAADGTAVLVDIELLLFHDTYCPTESGKLCQ